MVKGKTNDILVVTWDFLDAQLNTKPHLNTVIAVACPDRYESNEPCRSFRVSLSPRSYFL